MWALAWQHSVLCPWLKSNSIAEISLLYVLTSKTDIPLYFDPHVTGSQRLVWCVPLQRKTGHLSVKDGLRCGFCHGEKMSKTWVMGEKRCSPRQKSGDYTPADRVLVKTYEAQDNSSDCVTAYLVPALGTLVTTSILPWEMVVYSHNG